jgi:hypothetical protein
LNPSNLFKKSIGLPIILTHDFQSELFGFFLASTSMTSFQKPAKMYIVAANTSGTPTGGFVNFLAKSKSYFFKLLRAASAFCTNGTAASKSAWVLVFFSSTSFLMVAQLLASMVAF